MKRSVMAMLLFAVAACSAPGSDDGTTDDADLTATDSADPVLFAIDNVKALELTIAPDDVKRLSDQANGVAAQRISGFDERPKAKAKLAYKGPAVRVTPTCDVTKPYDVTVKIKGMASVQGFDKKPSLRIDFDKPFCGLKNLTLNNMVQDNTLVNEALAYKMYAAMGVPVPRTGFSQVTVNGQSLGVYLTLETIDKNFLKRNFDDATGPLYEGTYGGDLRASDVGTPKLAYGGSDSAPEATDPKLLRELIAAVNAPGDAVFFGSPALVDTNEFLNMMAMAYVIGDWDNYITANNYRIYKSPKTGLWSFIPTGTDQTFHERLHPFRGFQNRDASFSVLFEKCVGSSRCLVEYQKRLAIAVQKLKEPDGTLKGTAARRAALIDAAVKTDRRRPQNDASIATARAALDQFIDARAADIADASKCIVSGAEIYRGACAGLVVRNAADNRCLDSYGSTQTDGAPFALYGCHGKSNQRMLVKPFPGNEYEVHPLQSDKCLDVPGQRLDEGLQLQQWACHGGPNQRFTMKELAGGVQLVAKVSGKCVGGAAADSGDVVQKTCAQEKAQLWRLAGSLFD
jgi:hypothetical protein